jgi:hypothetical protein
MSEDQISYRVFRPELPLAAWVREQRQPVVVHRQDLAALQAAGAANVVALPHGGPLRGEAWLPEPKQ